MVWSQKLSFFMLNVKTPEFYNLFVLWELKIPEITLEYIVISSTARSAKELL